MIKRSLLILCCCINLVSYAQSPSQNEDAAKLLIKNNQKILGFSDAEIENLRIQNSYFEQTLQTQLVYALPTYKGLILHNQYRVMSFKNNIAVHQSGSILSTSRLKFPDTQPQVNAYSALQTALAESGLNASNHLHIKSSSSDGTHISFEDSLLSEQEITADLMWVISKKNKSEIFLGWQITVAPKRNSDYWQIRVNAHTNTVIDKTNLTIYCNWDTPHTDAIFESHPHEHANNSATFIQTQSPEIINGASYRVVPFPAESPTHPGGTPVLITDPWTAATGNATSLKWHSNGSQDYSFTRGNNVWAKEDRAANNSNANSPANSSTADPLTFDFAPNFSVDATSTSPVPNQQFNITNLFYWNNILHDISYLYGFDEPAGNFQANNQGRGGNGNDFVYADAQDGAGFNNANFSVPPDGIPGRMQMFLWGGNPRRDGDVDNGVISHEYSHGISNRLTGGGSSGCLGSAEQMGEGWSDYIALMVTQNWAGSSLTDGFSKPRGIGTYLMGQSNNGLGIRSQRYSTNLAINNKMYTANLPTVQHDRGEIWCAALWDMTWNIIQQTGVINPNLYDVNAAGGNSIALKLVMQGMKLQPCDPGFLDARDAILAADQLLYGGLYRCAIVQAFARRGMGFNAKQGSAYSLTDQVPGFSTEEATLTLTQSVSAQAEGQQVTYNHTVTAGACADIQNYMLRDTLPSNVSYVSGGNYDAGTRVVSFPVQITAGNTASYAYTVSINNGSYYPTETILQETVANNSLPTGWTVNSISSLNWVSSATSAHSPTHALFANDNGTLSDFSIVSVPVNLTGPAPNLSFWHKFDTEDTWDGGVVEISTNNGTTWNDLGNYMVENPYNRIMDVGNALTGRGAFSGNSNGFIKTTISLDAFANQNIRLRFRFASDNNTGADGWYVDDILMMKEARVNIQSQLFNAANALVATQDTFTLIVEDPLACNPVEIITPAPALVHACANTNLQLTVGANGTQPQFQWQVSSTGCSGTYTDIAGATNADLNLQNLSAAQNNFAYRVIVRNSCPSSDTSACTVLQINPQININQQPNAVSVCSQETAVFNVSATGTDLSYQWQMSNDGGNNFTDISNASSAVLSINNVSANQNGNLYRVRITGSCNTQDLYSSTALLTVNSPALITQQPASVSKCVGNDASFAITATGMGLTYQWQVSTDNGIHYQPIAGANANAYTLNDVALAHNGNRYRVVISSEVCAGATSAAAVLTVSLPPTVTISVNGNTTITPNSQATLTASVSAPGNYVYQWWLNNAIIPGANAATHLVSIDQIGDYRVTVHDAETGCTASSNSISMAASSSPNLFIYPSPNSGHFQVRYYSDVINSRLLNIYDSKGARIFSKLYPIQAGYTQMWVDMQKAAAGIYRVELLDKEGIRLATGNVLIL